MIKKVIIPASFFLLIFASCASRISLEESASVVLRDDVKPVPELSPAEVVLIQLTAFKENNSEDEGIALAYRFASPRNKRITGDVENFANIIRREPYSPILYNADFELGPVENSGSLAFVAVRVDQSDNSSKGYLFVLSLQNGGEYDKCWLTDGVLQINMERLSELEVPATSDI